MLKLLSYSLFLIVLCLFTASYLSNKFSAADLHSVGSATSALNRGESSNAGNNSSDLPRFVYSDNQISIPDGEGFGFEKSSDKLVGSQSSEAYWQAIASAIAQNKGEKLYLQGTYIVSETNSTKFANLGLARAEAIKQKLVVMGAPAASIVTSGSKSSSAFFAGNTYVGGVNLMTEPPKAMIPTAPVARKSLAENEEKKGDLIQPLNMYYDKSEKSINITPQIKAYFDELKLYLDKNPTAKVSILGFTDNQGDSLKNVEISTRRAEMVRDFMVSKKFDAEKLIMRGKGPLRPIGNNETDAGRKQNRRVEVRLMYN